MSTEPDFASMIEMDLTAAEIASMRVAHASHATDAQIGETPAERGVTFCSCPLHNRPAGTIAVLGRQVCGRCSHPRRPVPTRITRPVDLAGEQAAAVERAQDAAPAGFGEMAAEAAHNAASAGLVRGGMLPADVNSVAGYNVPVIAARGEATRYVPELVADRAKRLAREADGRVKDQTGVTYLTPGDLMAGVAEGAIGGLLSWEGRGSITRGRIVEVLASAGLPATLAPKAKSAHAQAGHVLGSLNLSGYVVRAVPASTRKATESWVARWTAALVSTSVDVGESIGAVAMVATLDRNDTLTIDGYGPGVDSVAGLIRTFDERKAAEVFTAAEVTDWLARTVKRTWGGAQLGGSWFVPTATVGAAERLCTALAGSWGRAWMTPAIPLTNSPTLRGSLATAIVREAEEILADLQVAQAEAATAGRTGITDARASTLANHLADVNARLASYSAVLGNVEVAGVRARVATALAAVEGLTSDISRRFSLIFEELARDGAA